MALTSAAELRTEVTSWLERNDLTTDRLNAFITLTESYANRFLRVPSMERRALIASTEGRLVIPLDFLELRNICYIGTEDSQDRYDLEYATFERVNTHRLMTTDTIPTIYTRQANFWYVSCMVEDDEIFEVRYYRFITPLDDINSPDNWLLQVAPEVYLFGCLYFGYLYLQDENKAGYWEAKFKDALQAVQDQALDADAGAHGRVKNLDRMGSEI